MKQKPNKAISILIALSLILQLTTMTAFAEEIETTQNEQVAQDEQNEQVGDTEQNTESTDETSTTDSADSED